MKNLLIISSTQNSNLDLSKKINEFFHQKDNLNSKVISLEDFKLPLYTPTLEQKFKEMNEFPAGIVDIKDCLVSSSALIWCSPEYNGGVSPILTNSIAWISRTTDNWKDAFIDKNMLICSSSGGNGNSFIKSFEIQLNYLGAIVYNQSIVQTKKNGHDQDLFIEVLTNFSNLINN